MSKRLSQNQDISKFFVKRPMLATSSSTPPTSADRSKIEQTNSDETSDGNNATF